MQHCGKEKRCPTCGDGSLVGARCTVEIPAKHCDTPGSPHRHWICTRCLTEWVKLQTAEKLAAFASKN